MGRSIGLSILFTLLAGTHPLSANDARLLGTWKTLTYTTQEVEYPLEGLMVFTPNYFSSNAMFKKGGNPQEPTADSNWGPYRTDSGKLYFTPRMQLHLQVGAPDSTFVRGGADETARYEVVGNRLTIHFSAGSSYLLERMTDSQHMEMIEGLWSYDTLQIGETHPVPLTGLFFLQNGRFLQHTINDGDPFTDQLGMGHSGTYEWKGGVIHLFARVGLMVEPTSNPILESRSNSVHHIEPERSGDALTLSFDLGVIQRLTRVGQGDAFGEIVQLEDGALGLVGDHFILVAEHPGESVAGSGRFTRSQGGLRFEVNRWFTLKGNQARYQKEGVIEAGFDGKDLGLPGGVTFRVRR